MMPFVRISVAILLLSSACSWTGENSEITQARITGRVVDIESNRPLHGIPVMLEKLRSATTAESMGVYQVISETKTDQDGYFEFYAPYRKGEKLQVSSRTEGQIFGGGLQGLTEEDVLGDGEVDVVITHTTYNAKDKP